jgi:hypothetical protein
MEIDLDRVARRRSRTLAPEITALLTAREHSDVANQSGKSPRSRNAGDRDTIQHGKSLSRSTSLNNARDAAKADAIGAPAQDNATTRKRMTLGRRVMNPILSIFSIGPAGKEPEPQHAHPQSGQPLRRSTSVQASTGLDIIGHSSSNHELHTARNAPVTARRKRREKPLDRNISPSELGGIDKRSSEPLRSSQHMHKSQDDITKGKERMDPRDAAKHSPRSHSSSASTSPRRMHTLRPVASREGLNNTTIPAASRQSPPATERSAVDSQPSRQQFAKLRPVHAPDPTTRHLPAGQHVEHKPEPKAAAQPAALTVSVSNMSLASNPSPRKKEPANAKLKASPEGKPKASHGKGSTFGVRLQPLAADDKRSMPLPPSDIQKERAKVIQRVRERAAKEQSEAGEKRSKPDAPLPTPSPTVFPPELMQEVKVEDLLREQFTGEKENALLLGEMPLLTKKRHSLNVTELFGVHIVRSTSQDLAAQKQLSARGSARGGNLKLVPRERTPADDGSVLREAKAAKEKKAAEPVEETPAEELVNPEALRQLKALYPHLLDSVLESLLRSADGDVEQATLYLQKKGWVSEEPAAANAHQNEAKNSPAKKSGAFSTLRNIIGGKKNPFALPEGQHTSRGSKSVSTGNQPTKRKGVKF